MSFQNYFQDVFMTFFEAWSFGLNRLLIELQYIYDIFMIYLMALEGVDV